jgi:hypothetical protein
MGVGDGTFGTEECYYEGVVSVARLVIADVNGDDAYDVVLNTVAVLLGHDDGTFAEPVFSEAGTGIAGLAVADFDGDTDLDVAVGNFASYKGETVTVMLNALPCGNCEVDAGEDCDGGACCAADCTFLSPETVCRASQGPCDMIESCTGALVDCPPDQFANSATICDPAEEPCELDIYCDGLGSSCPLIAHICDDGDPCTADVCTAGETCTHTDITGLPCGSDADCDGPFVGHATCETGFCAWATTRMRHPSSARRRC